ncbi:MAG: glycosyltransferase, partial [Candidatus Latescibacteria bacterium]|nr:glycosyltransferase [Candidatus Latescibacterota bacterium]NIO77468.1 glycosyltransferase [Candidatus Latescibacterota bacterium]
MSNLSVIVITQNEEGNIRDCLASVTWADEIVVIDSQSSDRTVELASRYTAHIHVRPWKGYAEAKNYALAQASSDWILWLDADERVTPELAEEIKGVVGQNRRDSVG